MAAFRAKMLRSNIRSGHDRPRISKRINPNRVAYSERIGHTDRNVNAVKSDVFSAGHNAYVTNGQAGNLVQVRLEYQTWSFERLKTTEQEKRHSLILGGNNDRVVRDECYDQQKDNGKNREI